MQSVPISFWHWLSTLDSNDQFGMISILMVFGSIALVLIVGLVSLTAYKIHRTRLETALKREMLERGMSAEEIAAVIRTRPAKGRGCGTGVA